MVRKVKGQRSTRKNYFCHSGKWKFGKGHLLSQTKSARHQQDVQQECFAYIFFRGAIRGWIWLGRGSCSNHKLFCRFACLFASFIHAFLVIWNGNKCARGGRWMKNGIFLWQSRNGWRHLYGRKIVWHIFAHCCLCLFRSARLEERAFIFFGWVKMKIHIPFAELNIILSLISRIRH